MVSVVGCVRLAALLVLAEKGGWPAWSGDHGLLIDCELAWGCRDWTGHAWVLTGPGECLAGTVPVSLYRVPFGADRVSLPFSIPSMGISSSPMSNQ